MSIRLLCLDVDGTLADAFVRPTVPDAAALLRSLRERLPVRLVTNASTESHARLCARLATLDLLSDPAELVTPARTARELLLERGHASGILLCEERAKEDFDWFREDPEGPAVLLATEGHRWTLASFQPAFRRLLEPGAVLYSLQRNRYYRLRGELVTDLGPLSAYFEYATGCEVVNLGKPSPALFGTLARNFGVELAEIAMVGDDAEFDASGATRLGMQGVLVRTGKYRSGDEDRFDPCPRAVLDSILDLPAWLDRVATSP